MDCEIFWRLFWETGNLVFYSLYKELEEERAASVPA